MKFPVRTALWSVTTAVVLAIGLACSEDPDIPTTTAAPPPATPAFAISLAAEDEAGQPLPGATVAVDGQERAPGVIDGLVGTTLAVVRHAGYLDEPVVLHREDAGQTVTVRLLRTEGAAGERRLVMHFAGDAMLGRRYQAPVRTDTLAVDGAAEARQVVAALAPLFRAADFRSLNFESVIGELTRSQAYPRKRFLLQSPGYATAILDELGVNFVALGNNHTRDWLQEGVVSTLAALDAADIPHAGAGTTEAQARQGRLQSVAGYSVGSLSYTSVNGNFVNDSYPVDADPVPPDLPPEEAWQYELRSFGFTGPTVSIPPADRRLGEAWQVFKGVEPGVVDPQELADLYAALTAVYPEIQDWVARRGHGGANLYREDRIAADIADLRAGGAELVVVQFHSGFQFREVKSEFLETAAHNAIDQGADLVICHHPHVLQGFEWYRGKLVAYSLGNIVFDQDFLVTFSSAVLRVVFEETAVLSARVYPVVLHNYRPTPVGGAAARTILLDVLERSFLEARSERVDGLVYNLVAPLAPGAEKPVFRFHNQALEVSRGTPTATTEAVDVAGGARHDLSFGLTRSRQPDGSPTGLAFGRDVLGWGGFEDDGADGASNGGIHWDTTEVSKRVEVVSDAPRGIRALRLRRTPSNDFSLVARPVARIPVPAHRLHRDDGSGPVPADGPASYTLRFQARLSGDGQPFVRFDMYDFFDLDPTVDPSSTLLRSVAYDVDVPADGAFHEVQFEVPAGIFDPVDGVRPNSMFAYVGLDVPVSRTTRLFVDELQVLEWRQADLLPDDFFRVEAVRAAGSRAATLERITAE